jgi:hypothetical protein
VKSLGINSYIFINIIYLHYFSKFSLVWISGLWWQKTRKNSKTTDDMKSCIPSRHTKAYQKTSFFKAFIIWKCPFRSMPFLSSDMWAFLVLLNFYRELLL